MPSIHQVDLHRATNQQWSIALSRKLPSVTKRLRTLLSSHDARLFFSTHSCINALHCLKTLTTTTASSKPISHFPQTLNSQFCSATTTSPPATAHELVFDHSPPSSRKDTSTGLADVVSLTLLNDACLAVVFGDGNLALIEPQHALLHDGTWGGLWAPWPHRPISLSGPRDVNFVSTTRLPANPPASHHQVPTIPEFLVVARASGVYAYDAHRVINAAFATIPPLTCFTSEWSNIVECCDVVNSSLHHHRFAVIAISGQNGSIFVYALKWKHGTANLLENQLLWALNLVVPVSSLSFCTDSARHPTLTLSASAGNDIVLVEWGDGSPLLESQWLQPFVMRLKDAHDSLVTSVQVLADGTVISAGTDGQLLLWNIHTIHKTQPNRLKASCTVLQERNHTLEPVMSAVRTTNGFGVFALTTSLRSRTEVGEPSTGTIRKYLGSGRRSMVALLVLPMPKDPAALDNAVIKCMQRYLSSAWIARPICFWDLGMFIAGQDNEKPNLMPMSRSRLADLLQLHTRVEDGKEGHMTKHPKWLRLQRAKTCLCFAVLIVRSGLVNSAELTNLKAIIARLRNFLLCMHYDECIRNVLAHPQLLQSFSELEFKSLESMCDFVSICAAMTNEATEKLGRVVEIRKLLQSWMRQGVSSITLCPVCECEGTKSPLVADGEDITSFYCNSQDFFVRCVRNCLPCLDVVPLQCIGCSARASQQEFSWIDQGSKCPLCNCSLLAGSVEAF